MVSKRPVVSVRLISHASVVIDIGGTRILTDPWWRGRCFNGSWALMAEPADLDLNSIDCLWISHEHPDHFHIQTLKNLPPSFRERVVVLFQQSSDHLKMVRAFQDLGFKKILLLPHKRWVRIRGIDVLCYQSRQIDSALAIRCAEGKVLNMNDCDFGPYDWKVLRRIIGQPDIVFNQFSLGGFDGIEKRLPIVAERILDNVVAAHRTLGAKVTIPFASFFYFCCQDNQFLNGYANSPRQVARRFAAERLDLVVLTPGQAYTCGAFDNTAGLTWWDEKSHSTLSSLLIAPESAVSLSEIEAAFRDRCLRLNEFHAIWTLLLRPVVVDVGALGILRFDFRRGTLDATSDEPDLKINPQPLLFLLQYDYGMQTLGVSGRYRLLRNKRNWTLHRILFAMVNAGIGLSWKMLTRTEQLRFLWLRRADLTRQVGYSLRRTWLS